MLGFAACIYLKVTVTLVYDTFIGIITATILWSIVIALIVYVMARNQKKGLSPGGNTGTCIKNNVVFVLEGHLFTFGVFNATKIDLKGFFNRYTRFDAYCIYSCSLK